MPGYSYTDAEQERYLLDAASKAVQGSVYEKFLVMSTFDHEPNGVSTHYEKNLGTLAKLGPISLSQLKAFIIEIFGTLDYLYRKGIAHFDMKPDNALALDAKGLRLPTELKVHNFKVKLAKVPMYAKIIDWGLGADVKKNKFTEIFIQRDEKACMKPMYDIINFLNKINQYSTFEARHFIGRIVRAIFGHSKGEFNTKKSCTSASKKIKNFKFSDLFLLKDYDGPLFDIQK